MKFDPSFTLGTLISAGTFMMTVWFSLKRLALWLYNDRKQALDRIRTLEEAVRELSSLMSDIKALIANKSN